MSSGGRLVLPSTDPVFTSGGLLNVGASLTVYLTGSTTLAAIFADVDLVTQISNPQFSDAAGRFYAQSTQICVDETQAYDCLLTLTDGETFTYTQVYALGAAQTVTGFAPINSPVFTGNPQAPTPAAGNNSASIATTAFVTAAIAAIGAGQVALFLNQQASGTSSGETLTNATWDQRTLNTSALNNIPGCTLATNQVTFAQPGTYLFFGVLTTANSAGGFSMKHRLRDTTNSINLVDGPGSVSTTDAWSASFFGVFTTTGSVVAEVDTYSGASAGVTTGGAALSSGDPEIYVSALFLKIG